MITGKLFEGSHDLPRVGAIVTDGTDCYRIVSRMRDQRDSQSGAPWITVELELAGDLASWDDATDGEIDSSRLKIDSEDEVDSE